MLLFAKNGLKKTFARPFLLVQIFTISYNVFFTNKKQGCFELDRDWISNPGNAVENIYSVNDNFTPGQYQVKVHHFGGVVGRRYNCRVIINGVVVKSVSGAIGTNKQFDDIYSFNVE